MKLLVLALLLPLTGCTMSIPINERNRLDVIVVVELKLVNEDPLPEIWLK
jgi:hypothetical protein